MSLDTDEEERLSSKSDGYDSDQICSDFENELYSQIYHNSHVDCSDFVEENNVNTAVINLGGQNSVPSIPLRSSIPKTCVGLNQHSDHSFTPKTLSNTRTVNNSYIATNNLTHYSSDSSESDCDDGVVFIDSWDSTNNVVTNVANTLKHVDNQHCEEFKSHEFDENEYEVESECNSTTSSIIVLDEVKKSDIDFTPITVDSDSSSESSSEPENYLSRSLPIELERTIGENNKWQIDIEDRMRPCKSKRYFRKSETNCRICKGFGHVTGTCPKQTIKCYLCGGSHTSFRCKKKICGICFESGHTRTFCDLNCRDIYCENCKLFGHVKNRCPDIWRRYSFTLSENGIKGQPENVEESNAKYCYNCGAQGHLGYSCSKPRFLRSSLPASPYIIKKNSKVRYVKQKKNLCKQNQSFLTPKKPSLPIFLQNEMNNCTSAGSKRKQIAKRKKVSNEEPAFIRSPAVMNSTAENVSKKKKRKKFLKWKIMQKNSK